MALEVSVLICTHNPRAEYLQRVLAALASQTLPRDQWELIIIDNASTPPVWERIDAQAAPNPSIVIESTLGLTPARLCGIRASKGDVLVFVDDDNVLAPDYLEHVVRIGADWPQLGTWGGQASPGWEVQPPEWSRPYWNWIGIREFTGELWSNIPNDTRTAPFGAGMCVRRRVAEAYASSLENDPIRRALGRTGARLTGSEDSDIAFTACDVGLGNGIFDRLKLTHLMPPRRTEEDYLLQLVESQTFSHTLLLHRRGIEPTVPSRAQRLLEKYQSMFITPRDRRFAEARRRGLLLAVEEIRAAKSASRP